MDSGDVSDDRKAVAMYLILPLLVLMVTCKGVKANYLPSPGSGANVLSMLSPCVIEERAFFLSFY